MSRRVVSAVFVSLALATAIHTDWHFARPTTHHLSLGLSWHWALAVPVFALAGWYVARVWPQDIALASTWILGTAILMGGVIEPAWEYFVAGATREWAFGAVRNMALLTFTLAGLIAYAFVVIVVRRDSQRTVDVR